MLAKSDMENCSHLDYVMLICFLGRYPGKACNTIAKFKQNLALIKPIRNISYDTDTQSARTGGTQAVNHKVTRYRPEIIRQIKIWYR